jgi:hypothetical protein
MRLSDDNSELIRVSELIPVGWSLFPFGAFRAFSPPCPFRKFHPTWVRVVRQNHRIVRADACNHALTWNDRRRLVQVAVPA